MLATHVDDMPHIASNPEILHYFHHNITRRWDCKFPDPGFCLGVNILHDMSKKEIITLPNSVYISKVIAKYFPQGMHAR